jgi:hypothetical protein
MAKQAEEQEYPVVLTLRLLQRQGVCIHGLRAVFVDTENRSFEYRI